MHKFLARPCKSQYFAQNQKKIARLHDRVTVTFRNSAALQTSLRAESLKDYTEEL